MTTKNSIQSHVHPVVFPISAGVIVLFVIWGVLSGISLTEGTFLHGSADLVLGGLSDLIIDNLSWFFISAVASFIVFLLYIVLSRYGSVRLGPDDARPDFGYLTWFAMLFSAGMGIGLVFYGVAEPIFHFVDAPRVDTAADPAAAAAEAMTLTFHHWGLGAWSVYAVLGLSLAYFGYRHNLPMTIRSALYPLIGERIHGWAGNLVDILAVFGTMFGIATSLGLGVAQINAGLSSAADYLGFSIPQSTWVQIVLIGVITVAATVSVVTGIDKGIRRLSEMNITLAGVLLVFVAITGPTLLILSAYVENIGSYVYNFLDVLTWSGAYEGQDFMSDWTIFYWAWWISWAPFVGTFIARISRGRTIREFVLGVLAVPSLVSFLWFTVMGNSAISFQQTHDDPEATGGVDIYGAMEAADFDESLAMFSFLDGLPFPLFLTIATVFIIAVFFVTSSDSGSFVIDMISSGGDPNPPVGTRIFWSVSEGAVASVLLIAGGLDALQAGAIVTGLPFTVVLLFVMAGILKGLRSERDGVTLKDVVAMPLIEGEGEAEVSRPKPRPEQRDKTGGPA